MSKIISGLGVALFVAAIVVGTTGAYFTDSKSTGENRFSAGTLSIGIDQSMHGGLPVIVNNWAPGSEAKVQYAVKNTGSLPVHIRSAYHGAWDFGGDAKVFKVTSVDKFNESNSTWTPVMQKTQGLEQNSPVFLSSDGTENGLVAIAPGQTVNLRLSVLFDPVAGNEYQGKQFTAFVTIDAKQVTEGASWPSSSEGGATGSVRINSVSPTSGKSGTTVTITGSGFATSNFVLFGNATGSFTLERPKSDNNTITFTVPNTVSGAFTVMVVNENGTSNNVPFTLIKEDGQTSSAVINELSPNVAKAGQTVVVKGHGFVIGTNHILFEKQDGTGGTNFVSTSSNGTSLTFTVPNFVDGMYLVTVVNSGGKSNSLPFSLQLGGGEVAKVVINSVTPNRTSAFNSVSIMGSGFVVGEENFVILSNSSGGSQTLKGNSHNGQIINFEVPNISYGDYKVQVINSNGQSNLSSFTITEPTLSLKDISISKNSGFAGDTVVITGGGFVKNEDNFILFGSNQGSFTFSARPDNVSNVLTFTVPNTTPGSYNVEVMNSSGRSNPLEFNLLAVSSNPSITVLEPTTEGFIIKGTGIAVKWQGVNLKAGSSVNVYLRNIATNQRTLIASGVEAGRGETEWEVPVTFTSGSYRAVVEENCASTGNSGGCALPRESSGVFQMVE